MDEMQLESQSVASIQEGLKARISNSLLKSTFRQFPICKISRSSLVIFMSNASFGHFLQKHNLVGGRTKGNRCCKLATTVFTGPSNSVKHNDQRFQSKVKGLITRKHRSSHTCKSTCCHEIRKRSPNRRQQRDD